MTALLPQTCQYNVIGSQVFMPPMKLFASGACPLTLAPEKSNPGCCTSQKGCPMDLNVHTARKVTALPVLAISEMVANIVRSMSAQHQA